MKKSIFIHIFSLLAVICTAQDSSRSNFTMLPNQLYSVKGGWLMNNQIICPTNLESYFAKNKEALRYYKKSKQQESLGQTIGILGFFSLVASAVTINNDNHLSGKLAIGSLVGILTGVIISNGADKKMEKAKCAYNSLH